MQNFTKTWRRGDFCGTLKRIKGETTILITDNDSAAMGKVLANGNQIEWQRDCWPRDYRWRELASEMLAWLNH